MKQHFPMHRTWFKRLRLTPASMWIDANTVPPTDWAARVFERATADPGGLP